MTIGAPAAAVTVEYRDIARARVVFRGGDTGLSETYSVSRGELAIELHGPRWSLRDVLTSPGRPASLTVQLPSALERKAPSLHLDSAAGNVDARGAFGRVAVETAAGDVHVTGAVNGLDIETAAGDVVLELASAPSSLHVETTAGNQRTVLPSGDYDISTDSVAGAVSNDFSTRVGSGPRYSFEAVAGDIRVERR